MCVRIQFKSFPDELKTYLLSLVNLKTIVFGLALILKLYFGLLNGSNFLEASIEGP